MSLGRPASPAGQTPQNYQDFGHYGQTASPGSAGRNFDLYAPQPLGQPYSEFVFRGDLPPPQTHSVTTPLGVASDSPKNLHRAMPQAPRQYNHQPANYEDIPDEPTGLVPPPHPRMDFRRTPPSPTESDRYATSTMTFFLVLQFSPCLLRNLEKYLTIT